MKRLKKLKKLKNKRETWAELLTEEEVKAILKGVSPWPNTEAPKKPEHSYT